MPQEEESAPDYVELKPTVEDGRVLHLLRADWERWGQPTTIEDFHAKRKALETGVSPTEPPPEPPAPEAEVDAEEAGDGDDA